MIFIHDYIGSSSVVEPQARYFISILWLWRTDEYVFLSESPHLKRRMCTYSSRYWI